MKGLYYHKYLDNSGYHVVDCVAVDEWCEFFLIRFHQKYGSHKFSLEPREALVCLEALGCVVPMVLLKNAIAEAICKAS